MASKANSNEQIDADILQCKADIRRAREIMSPYKRKPHEESKLKETSENAAPSTAAAKISPGREKIYRKDTAEVLAKQVKPDKSKPAGSVSAGQQKAEIPRFDLAEEIMAEQRKITAIKRKAPVKKIEAQNQEQEVESIGYTIEQPTPALSEQEQIIAEIVARDIERLCRDGNRNRDSNRSTHSQS